MTYDVIHAIDQSLLTPCTHWVQCRHGLSCLCSLIMYESVRFWYVSCILCDALNFYVAVGENYERKLLVFLCLYVGGWNELQPRGPLLRLPSGRILPADCRRPPLSLSWCGSPKGTAEWSKWSAWTYAVSLPLYMHIYTHRLWRNTDKYIATLVCFPVFILRFKSWRRRQPRMGLSSYAGVL